MYMYVVCLAMCVMFHCLSKVLSCLVPPTVSHRLQSSGADSATGTLRGSSESPMSYVWFKGAQKLKYCSGNTLRVASASTLDNGQYCCTVSNEYGSVLSDVVVVKVVLQRTPLPPITSYGEALIYMYCKTTNFSARLHLAKLAKNAKFNSR